jgi:hypothetical protein
LSGVWSLANPIAHRVGSRLACAFLVDKVGDREVHSVEVNGTREAIEALADSLSQHFHAPPSGRLIYRLVVFGGHGFASCYTELDAPGLVTPRDVSKLETLLEAQFGKGVVLISWQPIEPAPVEAETGVDVVGAARA